MTDSFLKSNPVYTGDPLDELIVGSKQAFYDWTSASSATPYYDRESKNFFITLKTDSNVFNDEVMRKAKADGLQKLIDFTYRNKEEGNFDNFLQFVDGSSWYLPPRPGSKVKILLKIPRIDFFAEFPPLAFSIDAFREKSKKKFVIEYDNFIKDSLELLRRIENIADFAFDVTSAITGVDFDKELEKIQNFLDVVSNILSYNSVDTKDFAISNQLFEMGFSEDGTTVEYVAIANTPLVIGFSEANESESFRSKRTVHYISSLQDIINLKDESWQEFLLQYTIDPIPSIIPGLSKVKNKVDGIFDKAERNRKKASRSINKTLDTIGVTKDVRQAVQINNFKSEQQKQEEDRALSPDLKYSIYRERKEQSDLIQGSFMFNIEAVLPKVNTFQDVFDEVIHKVDLRALTGFLMDCLVPELPNVPNIPTTLPTFPDLTLPKMPKIPTINILGSIRIDFDKILEIILREALTSIIRMIIEAIVKYCRGDNNLKNKGYGEANTDKIATIEAPENIVREVTGEMPDPQLALDFIDEIAKILTISELCDLLRGRSSASMRETIREFLEGAGEAYNPPFTDTWMVLTFFEKVGKALGATAVEVICREDPSIPYRVCLTANDIRELNRELYRFKLEIGEIDERQIDEQVALNEEIKQNIIEEINNTLLSDDFEKTLFESLGNQIRRFNPPSPAGVEDVFERTLNTTFSSIQTQFEEDFSNIFKDVTSSFYEENSQASLEDFRQQYLKVQGNIRNGIILQGILNNISSLNIQEDEEYVKNSAELLLNSSFNSSLFTSNIPLQSISRSIISNGEEMWSTKSHKEEASSLYNSLSLFDKNSNPKIPFEIILSQLENIMVRVAICELFFSSLAALSVAEPLNSFTVPEIFRQNIRFSLAPYINSTASSRIQEKFEQIFGSEKDGVLRGYKKVASSALDGGGSYDPMNLNEFFLKQTEAGLESGLFNLIDTTISFSANVLYNSVVFKQYFLTTFQPFTETKILLNSIYNNLLEYI